MKLRLQIASCHSIEFRYFIAWGARGRKFESCRPDHLLTRVEIRGWVHLCLITMATTTMVHVRVNEKIKAQAAKALAAMGLSISDAVRVFLTRVAADKQLPFDLKVPNAETRASMAEVDEMLSTRRARFATAEDL